MIMTPTYSIAIRTLGTAAEKYQKTLESIQSQTIKPEHVYIVIPHGYELPKERLGWEEFVRGEKGMVRQRIDSILLNTSDYMLLLDDDVAFSPTFCSEMIDTCLKTGADVCEPILREIGSGPVNSTYHYPLLKKVKDYLQGVHFYSSKESIYRTRIWETGGFISNINIKDGVQYYSQSGHGACCFASKKALEQIHFEDELWLEDTSYPLPEDQVMFFKLHRLGFKIAVNDNAYFLHLDAGTSNETNEGELRKIYASGRNNIIFWYKFIYKYSHGLSRLNCVLSLSRRIFFSLLFSFFQGLIKRGNLDKFRKYIKAYKDGFSYVKSMRINN